MVWREKYEIVNGFLDGHIYVADTLAVGDYFLEAYSRHSIKTNMEEYHQVRKIKRVDRIDTNIEETKKDRTDKKQLSQVQFNMFPEETMVKS